MEKINSFLNKQAQLASFIDNFTMNTNKTGRANRNAGFLNTRIELLNNYFRDFCNNHFALCSEVQDSLRSEYNYFEDDIYSSIESSFSVALGQIKEELATITASTMPPQVQASQSSHLNLHPPQQPYQRSFLQMQIPKFSGSILEWPSFKDHFVSVVVNDIRLTPVERLYHLKGHISGEAEELLRDVTITAANFESAWATLENHYENKRVLVNTHLNRFMSIQSINKESSSELKTLYFTATQSIRALKNINRPTEHWDDWLVFVTVSKLDPTSRKDWENSISSTTELPTFQDLEKFLLARIRTLEAVNCLKTNSKMSQPMDSRSNRITVKAHHSGESNTNVDTPRGNTNNRNKCPACNGRHQLSVCFVFKKKSVTQRREIVQKEKCCFNCLNKNHSSNECTSTYNCRFCNQHHHSLLHIDNNSAFVPTSTSTQQDSAMPSTPTQSASAVISNFSNGRPAIRRVLLPTALIMVKGQSGTQHQLRALLDQGSQATFISESAVQLLRLPKQTINAPICGISGSSVTIAKAKVQLIFSSRIVPSAEYQTDALVLNKVTNNLPTHSFEQLSWEHLKGIQLADPYFNSSSKIDIVLGADVYGSLLRKEVRNGPPCTPVGQNTVLGWILSGKIQEATATAITVMHADCDYQALEQQVRRFWEIEEVNIDNSITENEKICEDLFSSTHFRDSSGQYVVRLPFHSKIDMHVFGNTRPHAELRLRNTEHRLNRNIKIKEQYCEFMKNYEDLGHMQRIQETSIIQSTPKYYIPHHHVIKESSSSTKLRVVFDASTKGASGRSLNDILLPGPKLQTDLSSIVMRWRMHRVVFIADIEKMFRQIWVHKDDIDFQRILWRPPGEKIYDFQLKTVTYGTACAPYLAIRVLRQLANDERCRFPRAAKTLDEYCYVDDILSGSDDVTSCLQLQSELIQLLKSANFTLKKWSSNNERLLDHLPNDFKETCNFEIKDDQAIKTLGLHWAPSSDTFGFKIQLRESTSKPTKRSVLSDTAKLFDPLGWLAPVVVKAKILFQQLWLVGVAWDEPLTENLATSWLQFRSKLKQLDDIKLRRWINTSNKTNSIELHGFSDASCSAYAAVVYVRIVDENQIISTSLISAKTKVAPIKQKSLPRLELCGAVLLSQLLTKVFNAMEFDSIPVNAYTDSTIVLSWLNKHSSCWKTFVANRVSEIQSNPISIQWQHVSSADNPADCASRGIFPEELEHHHLWWNGPDWLQRDVVYRPSKVCVSETNLEQKSTIIVSSAVEVIPVRWDLIDNYSNLNRLVRVTAYCQRFVKMINSRQSSESSAANSREQLDQKTGKVSVFNIIPLTTIELQQAHRFCVKSVQQIEFATDLADLKSSHEVSRKSSLIKLKPFLDDEGIIRVGGRLRNSVLPFNEKHPVILPKGSNFTRLIISNAHSATLHGGTQVTLSYIRKSYWIVDGRNRVRHYIRNCVTCFRYASRSSTQIMGDLPRSRIVPSRPFLHTGIDYAGPIHIRTSKGRGHKSYKGYIAVFVCFATKAVHLELVTDQTTEAFVTAYRRFTSRRGICSDLYSDQGTNFIGANSQLQQQLIIATKGQANDLFDTLAAYGTQWHFNPPAAPHFGGLWESAVKSTKFHLKRVIGESTLTYEEMSSLLCQVEATLNSRPLCPLTADIDDLSVLTPGHFLVGEALHTIPEPNFIDCAENRLNRWQLVQRMYQHFWDRWSKEYLNIIQQRNKWSTTQPNISIGDLVLLRDERTSPSTWPLGRVVDRHPGSDQIVRVVTVKTQNSTFKRPITKVCVLPVNEK